MQDPSVVDTPRQDLRLGVRLLGRTPGFTCVAALSLALGIGFPAMPAEYGAPLWPSSACRASGLHPTWAPRQD